MKEKIISVSFVIILFSFSLFFLCKEDTLFSDIERRKLKTKEYLQEDVVENLEEYLTDQFPLRNNFLSLNSIWNRYILGNNEDNLVYLKEDYIIEKMYPIEKESINHFIKKINEMITEDLQNNEPYYMIIPDKSYFLNEKDILKVNYEELKKELKENIKGKEIDIFDLLELEDYYKTDIHLKQNSYLKIIEKLGENFNFSQKKIEYKEKSFKEFKGSSAAKVPFSKKEELNYLTNEEIENVKVTHLEYKEGKVYEESLLTSFDSYNVFLRGPSSFIEIENNNIEEEKELVIFRDSFSSSLAPLLIPYYKKITLVDLRYINKEEMKKHLEIKNQDILFAYSINVLKNSFLLK